MNEQNTNSQPVEVMHQSKNLLGVSPVNSKFFFSILLYGALLVIVALIVIQPDASSFLWLITISTIFLVSFACATHFDGKKLLGYMTALIIGEIVSSIVLVSVIDSEYAVFILVPLIPIMALCTVVGLGLGFVFRLILAHRIFPAILILFFLLTPILLYIILTKIM